MEGCGKSVTAERILQLGGLIGEVIPEPLGGAHRDVDDMMTRLKAKLIDTLHELKQLPLDELTEQRYQKFMAMGACG